MDLFNISISLITLLINPLVDKLISSMSPSYILDVLRNFNYFFYYCYIYIKRYKLFIYLYIYTSISNSYSFNPIEFICSTIFFNNSYIKPGSENEPISK